jgi:PIN domain nuclease of toxin-antitoxin system
MAEHVLDASAIIAYIRRETGWQKVEEALSGASASTVNLAEVGSRLLDLGYTIEDALDTMSSLRLRLVSFDEAQAIAAVRLRPLTSSSGLSLGDRACIALGSILGVPVLTTDKLWATVPVDVQVTLVR